MKTLDERAKNYVYEKHCVNGIAVVDFHIESPSEQAEMAGQPIYRPTFSDFKKEIE